MLHKKFRQLIAPASVVLSATVLSVPPSWAQEEGEEAEEVIVVGTRSNKVRSVADAPVPIDIIGADELNAVGGDADAIESLTALVPSFSANPQQGDGSAFVRAANLRGMPSDRSLVLVNGKRRHRSALLHLLAATDNQGAHSADIGHIPTIALKNIEVLRDGAAAQYGSDAIAGVMNLNLKDADSGQSVVVSYGQHFEGETNWKIAANVGAKMCDDGYINLSAETNHMDHLSRGTQNRRAQALIDAGVEGVAADAINEDGYVQTWGRPEQRGTRFVANMGCHISDNVKAYAFANYGQANGLWSFYYRHPQANLVTAQLGETFNYPADAGGVDSDGGHGAFAGDYVDRATNLQREKRAGFTPRLDADQQDYNIVVGMKGKDFMGLSANYDLSVSRGYNRIDYTLLNSLNPSIPLGVNCDHDLSGISGGEDIPCLGADDARVLIAVRDFDTTDLRQRETNINLDLSQALTASMLLSYGLEYREEEFTQYPGSWDARYGGGVSGMAGTKLAASGIYAQESYAAYADLEYDMSEMLLLQGAGRFEDSDYGSSFTGKLAARMKFSDAFTLRGSFSTGFKGPTPGQANYRTTTTSFESDGTEVRNQRVSATSDVAQEVGGTELENETSTNISFGMTSQFMQNMNLTVDFYLINLNNRIASTTVDGGILSTNPPIERRISFFTNAMDTQHMGLDVVLSHRIMDNSTLTLAYNYNTVSVEERRGVGDVPADEVITDEWINAIEKARPEHRFTLTSHTMIGDSLGLMARARYYGAHYDTDDTAGTFLEGPEPHGEIEATVYLDLEISCDVLENFTLVAGGMNILNTFPTEMLASNNVRNFEFHGMKYPIHSVADYQGGSWYLKGVYTF